MFCSLQCTYHISFVKFIPKYFILFDATEQGIIFVISFSDYLLLHHQNPVELCILNLIFSNFADFIY